MKKLLSVLLTISLLLTSTALISTTVSATEPEIWDGTVASSFASGTGLADDPFIIETAEQLAYFANSYSTFSEKYIKLANDIYLNDTTNWEEWKTNPPANEWTPIGTNSSYFSGNFDGDNHTIYGLYTVNFACGGLFKGNINNEVSYTVKNITIKDSYINATDYTGGIIAYATCAVIFNCHNYATIIGDTAGGISGFNGYIIKCSNYGYVDGELSAGGICGKSHTVNTTTNYISECFNSAPISGKGNVGGIIGELECQKYQDGYRVYVENCYNCGKIVSDSGFRGGICGLINAHSSSKYEGFYRYLFTNVYNAAEVVSGAQLIGYSYIKDSMTYSVRSSYYFNPVSTIQYGLGWVDYDKEGYYSCLSKDTALLQESYEGFDFDTIWTMDGNVDYPYPKLRNNFQAHAHSYVADSTEAKCAEEVIKTYTCHCGDFYTETLPATGHNHIESITTEATCTTAGLKTFTCHCGDTYTEIITAPGHSISTITVDPTCTEDGETYEACSVCKTVFGEKTPIPATGHTHSEEITTKATCTAAGLKTFTCSCGDTYTEAIPATGHKLKLITNAATCTSSGTQYNLCENCGNIIGETTLLPITGHKYNSVTQNATCTKDGLITYTCSCGDTYTETIPATGHSYTEEIKREPTCTASGLKWLICSCGNKKSETIPATGHNAVTDKAVAPTCTKTGLTEGSHCNTCGATITAQENIPANGHSYEEKTVTQATCTADGLKEFTCHCGDTYTEKIPATGHSHTGRITTEPTCSSTGIKTFTCNCGDSYTETVDKIAHSFGEWEYDSGNIYKRECTKCDEGIESKSIYLTLNKSSVNITNQSSYTLTATVTNNFTDDIVFTSSNSNVASVNSVGKITAENIGSATVTATIRGTNISAECMVNVTPRQFTITWTVDGVENVQTLNENAQITKPANPQKDGYKFVGWTPDVPQTMSAYNLTFTAVFEELYTCPHCGTEFDKENEYNVHVKGEEKQIAINKASIKIQNNPTSRTIKYGETLKLTATVTNMPEGTKIAWYVDGSKKAEGQTFSVSPSSGTVTVTVKLIDSDGNALVNSSGNELSDSQKVSVDSGFFQKIISFFKNLFGMNRTITQAFKGMF